MACRPNPTEDDTPNAKVIPLGAVAREAGNEKSRRRILYRQDERSCGTLTAVPAFASAFCVSCHRFG